MAKDKTKDKGSSLQHNRIKIDLLVHDIKSPLAVVETGISSLIRNRSKWGPLTEKQEKILKEKASALQEQVLGKIKKEE